MSIRSLIAFAVLTTAELCASPGTLYIAPTEQSSLATYNTPAFSLLNGFLAGVQATALAISPDGKSAYVGDSGEQRVAKFDIATGSLLLTFSVANQAANPVADLGVSSDGSVLYALTGVGDSEIFSFNTSTGAPIANAAAGFGATALAVEPDGKKVYVAQTLGVLDFDAAILQSSSSVNIFVKSLAFGPSSSVLYAGNPDSPGDGIYAIDTATDQGALVTNQPIIVNALSVSADGNSVFAATINGLYQVDTHTYEVINTFAPGQTFLFVAASPDGKTLAGIPFHNFLVEIVLADGSMVNARVNGIPDRVAYSPDGSRAYTLLESSDDIDYADESGGQVTGVIPQVPGNYLLAASGDGRKIAANNNAGQLSIIDSATHSIDYQFHHPTSYSKGGLALNSDGSLALFPVGYPAQLEIVNPASLQEITARFPNSSPNLAVVVSPDDSTAYVASPLCAIDIASGKLKKCGGATVEVSSGINRILALDSTGAHIFALTSSGVTAFDAGTLQALHSVSLGNVSPLGLTYSEANESVYVIAQNPLNAGSSIFRVDLASFTIVQSATITEVASDIAVSADGAKVYVAGDELGIPVLDGMTLTNIGLLGKVGASSVITAN